MGRAGTHYRDPTADIPGEKGPSIGEKPTAKGPETPSPTPATRSELAAWRFSLDHGVTFGRGGGKLGVLGKPYKCNWLRGMALKRSRGKGRGSGCDRRHCAGKESPGGTGFNWGILSVPSAPHALDVML
ncbi:hypothetical protein KIL84_003696 [Mauremys mutica]|uniref:Uncharacterized protein n=1 Tax=Mauremys mutica TaxID=74926 RepID=A0A9D3WWX5_9SAUR|nr:hypothetical protein KIL84_003696 [Mauremys mutica]